MDILTLIEAQEEQAGKWLPASSRQTGVTQSLSSAFGMLVIEMLVIER
jgi:hypothetical protein